MLFPQNTPHILRVRKHVAWCWVGSSGYICKYKGKQAQYAAPRKDGRVGWAIPGMFIQTNGLYNNKTS